VFATTGPNRRTTFGSPGAFAVGGGDPALAAKPEEATALKAATTATKRSNEQKMRRNPRRVFFASGRIRHDLSIFITNFLFWFRSRLTPPLEVIFGRSLVPSENFAPRYKENGCNAVFRPQIARYYG
jgi:hypothetical protein